MQPSPFRYLKVPHSFMHMVSVLPQAVKYENDIVEALLNAHGLGPLRTGTSVEARRKS